MRYAVIKQHEGQHGINLMCRVLGVSRSGYYDWKVRAPSARIRGHDLTKLQRLFESGPNGA